MTITLNQLSDLGYKLVGEAFFLEFGSAADDINITNVWYKMSGEISGSSATLIINSVSPTPVATNFRYRIESPFQVINGQENQPLLNLVIQNDKQGVPTLYAFIGSDDMDMTRTYAGSFIAISDLNEIYFTVENGTFKFYYQPL